MNENIIDYLLKMNKMHYLAFFFLLQVQSYFNVLFNNNRVLLRKIKAEEYEKRTESTTRENRYAYISYRRLSRGKRKTRQ